MKNLQTSSVIHYPLLHDGNLEYYYGVRRESIVSNSNLAPLKKFVFLSKFVAAEKFQEASKTQKLTITLINFDKLCKSATAKVIAKPLFYECRRAVPLCDLSVCS